MRSAGLFVACMLLSVAAEAAPLKVAILPLKDSTGGAADAAQVERALIEAIEQTPSLQLVNLTPSRHLQGARAVAAETRSESRLNGRAQTLGRETGAARVLSVDIAPLGVGRALYLQVIDAGMAAWWD